MAIVVKTNSINKFIDRKTRSEIKKYDPDNPDLEFRMLMPNGSTRVTVAPGIKISYGGHITFTVNDDTYIIDDGYRNSLYKAGYIVYNNFDTQRSGSKEQGIELRNHIMETISKAAEYIGTESVHNELFDYEGDNRIDDIELFPLISKCTNFSVNMFVNFIKISFESKDYKFTMCIDTVNSIVSKNQERVKNDLPFYPFRKDIDKYGAVYFSLFAEKKDTDDINAVGKLDTADESLKKLLYILSIVDKDASYKFLPLMIKKKLIYWEGI